MAVKDLVMKAIAENKVVVFSKSYCPYCVRAKKLLDSLPGGKYALFELNQRQDGDEIQDYLYELTRQRTVPNIFINQKHVGGCDDIHRLHSQGQLQPLLNA